VLDMNTGRFGAEMTNACQLGSLATRLSITTITLHCKNPCFLCVVARHTNYIALINQTVASGVPRDETLILACIQRTGHGCWLPHMVLCFHLRIFETAVPIWRLRPTQIQCHIRCRVVVVVVLVTNKSSTCITCTQHQSLHNQLRIVLSRSMRLLLTKVTRTSTTARGLREHSLSRLGCEPYGLICTADEPAGPTETTYSPQPM
jgi:hypothetical protein